MPLNPLETAFTSGVTLYAVLHNPDGTIWNAVNGAWEAYADGNWASYAIALTEQGTSGYYRGTFPAGAAAVLTSDVVYQQAGGSPALGDAPATGVGQSQGSDVYAIKTSVVAASNLQVSALSMIQGTVAAGVSTASKIYTNLTDTVNTYQGRIIIFASGSIIRQVANIASFDATGKFLTLAGAFTSAPAEGDTFIIV